MNKCGGVLKKLRVLPLWMRGASVGVIILALLLQANYAVAAQMAAFLLKPSINRSVPPLEQNQALTAQPAADFSATSVSPILASEQASAITNRPKAEYEDKSKRTEHTKTIIGTNGEATKRISLAEPMHYKRNGTWDDLKPATAKANDTVTLSVGDIKMSAKPLRQGIEYEYKGKKFSVTLEGSNNATPKLDKKDGVDVLVYENALDGIAEGQAGTRS